MLLRVNNHVRRLPENLSPLVQQIIVKGYNMVYGIDEHLDMFMFDSINETLNMIGFCEGLKEGDLKHFYYDGKVHYDSGLCELCFKKSIEYIDKQVS